jgi:hypothetical protein
MSYDVTETIRRELVQKINEDPDPRVELQEKYGAVWDTSEMQKEFSVTGFAAPYVVVTRKSDGWVFDVPT